jgi:hypothetical protein
LHDLARDYDYTQLASPGFSPSFGEKDYHRINIANQYVMDHFKNDISLSDVAFKVGADQSRFLPAF